MGFGKLFRGIFKASKSTSDELEELGDEVLDALWRASDLLSKPLAIKLRDEFVRRRRLLPLVFGRLPFRPGEIELDEALELESVLDYLKDADPRLRVRRPLPYRIGRTWVAVEADDDAHVLFLFPAWSRAAAGVPELPSDLSIGALVAMNEGDEGYLATSETASALGLGEGAVWAVRGDAPIDRLPGVQAGGSAPELPETASLEGLEVIRLPGALLADAAAPDRDEAWPLLIGARVPATLLRHESVPREVLGGLEWPPNVEEGSEFLDDDFELTDLLGVAGVTAMVDVAGTAGIHVAELAAGLHVPVRAVGSGVAVTAGAQAILDPLEGGDVAQAVTLAAGAELADLGSCVRYLVARGSGEQAEALLAEAEPPDEEAEPGLLPFLRGYLAELRGDEQAALTHYRAAVEAETPGFRALCQLAWHAAKGGDWEGARELADRAAEITADEPVSSGNRALIYWLGGDREDAMGVVQGGAADLTSWARHLVEGLVDDGEPEQDGFGVWSPAGIWLSPMISALRLADGGERPVAEALLRRCLELEPRNPDALGALLQLLVEEGREDEAIALCGDALERLPGFPQAYVLRAGAHARRGELDDAARDLREAVEIAPDQVDWRLSLILVFLALERGDAIEPELTELEAAGADMKLIADLRKLIP